LKEQKVLRFGGVLYRYFRHADAVINRRAFSWAGSRLPHEWKPEFELMLSTHLDYLRYRGRKSSPGLIFERRYNVQHHSTLGSTPTSTDFGFDSGAWIKHVGVLMKISSK